MQNGTEKPRFYQNGTPEVFPVQLRLFSRWERPCGLRSGRRCRRGGSGGCFGRRGRLCWSGLLGRFFGRGLGCRGFGCWRFLYHDRFLSRRRSLLGGCCCFLGRSRSLLRRRCRFLSRRRSLLRRCSRFLGRSRSLLRRRCRFLSRSRSLLRRRCRFLGRSRSPLRWGGLFRWGSRFLGGRSSFLGGGCFRSG